MAWFAESRATDVARWMGSLGGPWVPLGKRQLALMGDRAFATGFIVEDRFRWQLAGSSGMTIKSL